MIEIRKATKFDVEKILEIHKKSFYDDYIKYGVCPAYNETEKGLLDYIKNQLVYVILYNNEIVGDIIINIDNTDYYDLEVISIHPDYHNLGIGHKAMKFIEEDNSKISKWILHTPDKNTRNHYFYEKLGYIKVDEYKVNEKLTMYEFKKVIPDDRQFFKK